jgi:hypothetical protein
VSQKLCPIVTKVVPIVTKVSQVGQKCPKWDKSVPSGTKVSQVGQKCPKCAQVWQKVTWKWYNCCPNCDKVSLLRQHMCLNCDKWDTNCDVTVTNVYQLPLHRQCHMCYKIVSQLEQYRLHNSESIPNHSTWSKLTVKSCSEPFEVRKVKKENLLLCLEPLSILPPAVSTWEKYARSHFLLLSWAETSEGIFITTTKSKSHAEKSVKRNTCRSFLLD